MLDLTCLVGSSQGIVGSRAHCPGTVVAGRVDRWLGAAVVQVVMLGKPEITQVQQNVVGLTQIYKSWYLKRKVHHCDVVRAWKTT